MEEDGRHLSDIIIKTAPSSTVCLSFNFVSINVDLLEKQLSAVYFKVSGYCGSPCITTQ